MSLAIEIANLLVTHGGARIEIVRGGHAVTGEGKFFFLASGRVRLEIILSRRYLRETASQNPMPPSWVKSWKLSYELDSSEEIVQVGQVREGSLVFCLRVGEEKIFIHSYGPNPLLEEEKETKKLYYFPAIAK